MGNFFNSLLGNQNSEDGATGINFITLEPTYDLSKVTDSPEDEKKIKQVRDFYAGRVKTYSNQNTIIKIIILGVFLLFLWFKQSDNRIFYLFSYAAILAGVYFFHTFKRKKYQARLDELNDFISTHYLA